YRRKSGKVEGFGVGCVKGAVDGPFEPGHIRQIRKRNSRKEAHEEIGKCRTVFVEISAARRVNINEDSGGAFEELRADNVMDRRVGKTERRRQCADRGITIDVEALAWRKPVSNDKRVGLG